MSAKTWIIMAMTGCLMTGCASRPQPPKGHALRANHLITVADDFVVDVYLNGICVPDNRRELLLERFGATAERVNVSVHQGDWVVFHVVNDRLRWNGNEYFAAAGVLGTNEFGFVSETWSGNWTVCDDPTKARKFVLEKNYLNGHKAQLITHAWEEGTPRMKEFAGPVWAGEPVWGLSRDTWLKVLVK